VALETTQFLIRWVYGVFLGVKWLKHEADQKTIYCRLRMSEAVLYSPICFCGVDREIFK
jgi:hypothetical protein